ncbi:MAG: MTH1187 family thiamine-binding protein [Candidatus Nitrosotenuis sp.]|nr:MAG: MTH1187 family thiamine-binding protein [Candidatus Nitrosotenuis sp.]
MIHAEISVYPIGTDSTSMSIYVARAIEAISDFEGINYQITPMGTVLESDKIEKIFEASKIITETVHRMGVKRVEVVLKIDSRSDKVQTIQSKVDSVTKHLSKGP